MDELKSYLQDGFTDDAKEKIATEKTTLKKDTSATDKKNMELAKLYEDTAEYEAELKTFEEELEIINTNETKNISSELDKYISGEDRNYAQELKNILESTWKHLSEVAQTHSAEYVELIGKTEFCDVAEKLSSTYPDFNGNFETEVKKILVQRWKTLISIKKEHIKEEEDDLYIAGLKPSFVKKMYKKVHGIE